ncbi:MAG: MFS transporter [Alphaproteobacteria bacterium]|nr:MFS transporter [Alphaproteobacteria bacterium]
MRSLRAAPSAFKRNIPLLVVCWSLATSVSMTMVTISALTGSMLAEDKSFATLPIMLQWMGTAGATLPVSFFMQRYGRRAGFLLGAALIVIGAALAVNAVYQQSFVLFCLSTPFVGAGIGCNWYYRFAAADVADDDYRSRAISFVLAGGILAAFIAPNVAMWSRDLLAPVVFAGTFVSVAVFSILIMLIVAFIDIPPPPREDLHGGRPFVAIARQPAYRVALLGGIVSYSVMVLMMSVSPLAMMGHGLGFEDVAFVIQWHVLGMYLPSFFTGSLIHRLGTLRVMQVGAMLIVVCILLAISGLTLTHFWVSMFLLGVGWNFLFVGSTTLLTETYTNAERAKAQGVNDLMIFAVTGTATFLSGSLLHQISWTAVGLLALPAVVLVLVSIFWLAAYRRRVAA